MGTIKVQGSILNLLSMSIVLNPKDQYLLQSFMSRGALTREDIEGIMKESFLRYNNSTARTNKNKSNRKKDKHSAKRNRRSKRDIIEDEEEEEEDDNLENDPNLSNPAEIPPPSQTEYLE